ncbi:cysteine desulfurase family protein [Streptococcus cameli]
MIYLDNAATTSLSDQALQTLIEVSKEIFGNPSSIHSFGRKANQILRTARETIGKILEVPSSCIIFTSGGSEANNLAIKGYALSHQDKGKHIITTAIEHHSVLHTMEYLEKRFGFEITYIQPINQTISAQQIQEALRPDTILVSTMFANNETGDVLPIKEIGLLLRNHPAVFHVDAVQAIGKVPISPEELHIDFLSASAHKFHGPKGTGFLYSRLPRFDALIHGGKQESEHRAGTENIPSIAAMATALSHQIDMLDTNFQTVEALKKSFLQHLDATNYYLNQTQDCLPYVLNIGFTDQLNEQILMRLDLAGIAVSSGSACTAGVVQKSHVLEAYYGPNSHRLTESIRISFSEENTVAEIKRATQIINEIIGGAA